MKSLGLLILIFLVHNNTGYPQIHQSYLMIFDITEEDAQFLGDVYFISNWIAKNVELPSDLNKSE